VRRAARVDPAQAEIVDVLRDVGASVAPTSAVGAGFPDLVVGFRGRNYLLEVKQPEGPRGGSSSKGQQLNDEQMRWHQRWRGQVSVVRTPSDALRVIGADP
jgi:hypothetical protein